MPRSRVRCQPVTSVASEAGVAETESIWTPAVEVTESNSEFVVEAAIAGVEASDVDVQVSPNDVLIHAGVHHEHGTAKGTVHLCEFQSGQLRRVVHLPRPANPAKAHAQYRNGLLKVVVPVAAAATRAAVVPDPLSRRERP